MLADRLGLGLGGVALLAAAAAMAPIIVSISSATPARATQPSAPPPVTNDAPYRLAQIGAVTTYRPDGPIRGVALFLSGDGGWNLGVVDMARALTRQGVAVAGFSTPAFLKALETGKDSCVNPNYALAALAQDFEHRLKLPRYVKPILVGYSSGATVAYSALAQAPAGMYRGAVSLGFGPDLPGTKPWCASRALKTTAINHPERGWLFAPAHQLSAPWLVLQGLDDQVVSLETTRSFTAQVPQARLIELPKVGHGFAVQSNWMPQFVSAFAPLLEREAIASVTSTSLTTVDDLPLTLVSDATAPRTGLMAVMYSGDGGWVGIDRDVAASLAKAGVPVVGVDSLSYFWNARTPAGAAADLSRIIGHFSQAWGRPRTILFGYSFGADTLPAITAALPPPVRARIARVSLAGLSSSADFQFHLANWADVESDDARPTIPDVMRLAGLQVQCIYGDRDNDSACPALQPGAATVIALPGGHHFGGDNDAVARAVIGGLAT